MLILNRPWTRQPQQGALIDWDNPLTRGLKNAITFNGIVRDSVTGQIPVVQTVTGTLRYKPTLAGIALHTDNGSIASVDINEDWSGPSTTLWKCIVNHIDTPWGGMWAKNTTYPNQQLAVGRLDTTDTLYWGRENTSTTTITGSSINGFLGQLRTFAFTNESASASASVALFIDGQLIAASSYGATSQNTGLGSLLLGSERGATANYDSDVLWLSFMRFNRVLSAAEIAAIGRMPEALWQPRSLHIPTYSAAATVPTLSASTYVPGSLTSTGWRPRVTATY